MSNCPTCGRPNPWLASQCKCKRDKIDRLLQIGAAFDYITPTIEMIRESRVRPAERGKQDER